MSAGMNELFEFENFRLDPLQRLLQRNGCAISLTPKAFELLVVLVGRSGKLVEKDELLRTVWHDVTVEEGNLAVMVSHLRKALGDDPEKHQFIETVPKHGYRFVATVTRKPETAPGMDPDKGGLLAEGTPVWTSSLPISTSRFQFSWRQIVALGALSFCALGLAWRLATQKSAVQAEAEAIHSLAILPFQEIGQTQDKEFLGEGTADALITRLSSTDAIVVRPASAMEKYRNSTLSPVDIGRSETVDAVLYGRMQRQGDRVRLTIELLRVRDSAALWAD